jgi:hypothetical protein
MIFPDATLRLTVIMVIYFLSQKSQCAIATASSVVVVDERTNINPLRLLNRLKSILFTDREKLSILESSDAKLKSFELKVAKKKKVRATVIPTRIPTRVPSINKVMPLPKKTSPTKAVVPLEPTAPKPVGDKDNVHNDEPLQGNVPEGNKNDKSSPTSKSPGDKDDKVIGGTEPAAGAAKGKPAKVPQPTTSKVESTTKPSVAPTSISKDDAGKSAKAPQPNSQPTSKAESTTTSPDASINDAGDSDKENQPNSQPTTSKVKSPTTPPDASINDAGDSDEENQPNSQPTTSKVKSPTTPPDASINDAGDSDEENQPNSQPTTSKVKSPTTPPDASINDAGDSDKENRPSSQPIIRFESPTINLEKETSSPIAVIPTAAIQGNRKGRSKPSAAPSSSPPGITSISPPVDEALAAREKSALTSAKYFFYTFMACVAFCGVVYCIRGYGIRNFNGFILESTLERLIPPYYNLLTSIPPFDAQSVQERSHN